MAVRDSPSDSLRLQRTDVVPPDVTAWHVDQLTNSTFRQVVRTVEGEAAELDAASTRLDVGDVVVFTEYLCVVRV